MPTTNEQTVAAYETELSDLKDAYGLALSAVVKATALLAGPTQDQILQAHQAAVKYFNRAETLVGSSGLLGAHRNGLWVTGFAETCASILEAVSSHFTFIRSWKSMPGAAEITPSPGAYANMQRMVVEYLSVEEQEKLRALFVSNSLPTRGFDMPAEPDTKDISWPQIITSTAIGIAGLVGMLAIAIYIPNPTVWQQLVFRLAIALFVSAAVAVVPGFLNVRLRAKGWGTYLKVVAGGAIAVFVLVWFYSPPAVQPEQPSGTMPISEGK